MILNHMWPALTGLLGALTLFSAPVFAAPANDNFEDAQTLTGDWGSVDGSSVGSTSQPGEPLTVTYNCGSTIWYKWTPTQTGAVHFGTAGSGVVDTVMGVYTGSSLSNLTTITTNDDNTFNKASEVYFNAIAGTTYYIDIAGVSGASGSIFMGWDQNLSPNDNFADAQVISGASGSVEGNTADASLQSPEPLRAVYNCDRSVWYKWTPATSGVAVFDLSGSLLLDDGLTNSVIGVYTGSALNALTTVITDDDSGEESTAKATFNAVGGTTYYIAVAGKLGAYGNLHLDWAQQSPPSNDNFADAQLLVGESTPVLSSSVYGDNTFATTEVGEPILTAFPSGKSVWYKWTPTHSGTASFAVGGEGKSVPTCFAVYTGSALNSLTEVARSLGNTLYPSATFPVIGGTTYYVAIASYGVNTAGEPLVMVWDRAVKMGGRLTDASGAGIGFVKIDATRTSAGPSFNPFMYTDAAGYFQSSDLYPATFLLKPVLPGYVVNPVSRSVNLMGPTNDINFVATKITFSTGIAVSNATVAEGNSGTVNAVFTVSLSKASTVSVKVNYATSNDTAVAPNDYNAAANTLIFAPGETSKTVTIVVKGDLIDEIDERFNLNLSEPVNANITDNLGVCFITDDDAPPSLSINSLAISEGNTDLKLITFTVKLNVASSRTVTASVKSVPGSSTATTEPATANVDYIPLPATPLTFAPGELTKTFTVPIIGDTIDEANETFNMVLSAPGNATIGTATGIGTISDDDATPSFSINDVTLTENNVGSQNASFTISLSAPSGLLTKVTAASNDDTALAGPDYTALPATVYTFFPGQTSKVVTIAVKGDTISELTEKFQIKLTAPVGAVVTDNIGIGTIIDNDPTPSLSVTTVNIPEPASGQQSTLPFTFKLSGPSSRPVTVKIQTGPGTPYPAAVEADYVAIPLTTLTFEPGETTKVIDVTVKGDLSDEYDEKIAMNLSLVSNATLSAPKVEATIIDDDAPPSFIFSDIWAYEGNSGTSVMKFPVFLTQPSGKTVTISFKTGATWGNQATAGADYIAVPPTTFTFAPGEVFKHVPVTIIGDTFFEAGEHYGAIFSNAVNAVLENGERMGTIENDDQQARLSIADVSFTEGNSGSKPVTLTVKLSQACNVPVSVNYATMDGTATEGADYVAQTGTLTFSPGQLSKTINIAIKGDTIDEGTGETFEVGLSYFVGAMPDTDTTATVTILDDDEPSASKSGGSS